MENVGNREGSKNRQKFYCEKCNYNTSQNSDYVKHCSTLKHKMEKNGNRGNLENRGTTNDKKKHICNVCNRVFQSVSGLWKHNQKCKSKDNVIIDLILAQNKEIHEENKEIREENKQMKELVTTVLKQSSELSSGTKKDDELKELIMNVLKANTITNNTINNNNTSNSNNVISDSFNTFNLNLFLNETCKDAVNLSEFIENIKIRMEDMERIGQIGYVHGISEVINQNLNLLGIEKRPIHCTDAKRQVLYIKNDNEWTKEDKTMPRLQRIIDEVQKGNLRLLQIWKVKHPGCLTSNSLYTDCYNNLSQELMGGFCNKVSLTKKDERIRNMIIKDVTIDKQAHLNSFCLRKN